MNYQDKLLSQLLSASHDKVDDASKNAIEVYRNNYFETGINAMAIGFPSVYTILDYSDFRKLASAYLEAYPKTCFDWADYGENLAEFMYGIEALSELPFLPELAELDWRLLHLEREKNSEYEPDTFQLMQSEDIEQLVFRPAPGLQIMQAVFPVLELREMTRSNTKSNEQNSQTTVKAAKKFHIKDINKMINSAINSPVYRSIVLWREEYKAEYEYCDDIAKEAFDAVLAKRNIAEVLSCFGDDQNAMMNWLQTQIQSKTIFAIEPI